MSEQHESNYHKDEDGFFREGAQPADPRDEMTERDSELMIAIGQLAALQVDLHGCQLTNEIRESACEILDEVIDRLRKVGGYTETEE